jgi:hypothetical protein
VVVKNSPFISTLDLIDSKSVKGKFTWTNKRSIPRHIAAKLDRFMVTSVDIMVVAGGIYLHV